MKEKLKNSIILRCLKLIYATATIRDKVTLLLVFATAFVPAAVVLLEKVLFQKAELLPGGNKSLLYTAVILSAAIGGVLLLISLINNLSSYVVEKLQVSVRTKITEEMLAKLTTVKLNALEKPDVYEKLRMLSGTLDMQIRRSVDGIVRSVVAIITAISLVPVLIAEDWLVTGIIVISSVPLFFFMKKQGVDEYYTNQYNSKEDAQQFYLYRCFNRAERLREVQVGLLGGHLRSLWRALSETLNARRFSLNRHMLLYTVLANLVRYIGVGLALILVIWRISTGANDISSFIVVYTAAVSMQDALTTLFSNVSANALTKRYMQDFDDFLALGDEPKAENQENPLPECVDISIKDLKFCYPGSDRTALDGISLEIKQGEKIAIVGKNGSGKSTLISLLCGFYPPTEGSIRFAGQEVSENPAWVRRSLSIVAQNFNHFELTAAENIAIGNGGESVSPEAIKHAAEQSNASAVIEALPNGYDTHLGTIEEGVANLSGGQWQKIAYARSLIKENSLCMVLDEQTAALDAVAEAAFYKDFADIAQDKTVIMISHRLGATKLCSRIIVLNDGKIVEEGSHDQLMANNGLYAEMFRSQAGLYL